MLIAEWSLCIVLLPLCPEALCQLPESSNSKLRTSASPESASPTPRTPNELVPEELADDDWAGIRAAYEAGRHAVSRVDEGYRARNPGQQWTTHFDGRGFTTTPDSGNWTWGLQTEAYGWGVTEPVAPAPTAVTNDGQRVAYTWDERLTEWYLNDQRGLEHGFTVHARPEDAMGPLTLKLAICGGLLPAVSESGHDVRFIDSTGAQVVNYAGLTVVDADGEPLTATWTIVDQHLQLLVEDKAASYPLTIDPLAQQAYLKASNTEATDVFGYSISISGDTLVVGAPHEDSAATGINGDEFGFGASNSGATYVFIRNGTSWTQQAYIKASNSGKDDLFGSSVSISGDTLVVGSPGESSAAKGLNGDQSSNSAQNTGAAYIFVRDGATWTQQAYIKASNSDKGDMFGRSVSISGDTVLVGATGESSSATGVNGDQGNNDFLGAGAAYVFVRAGGTWTQEAYLKASNTGAFDVFGISVSVCGDTLIVGARDEASSAIGVDGDQSSNAAFWAGAAYIFFRNGSTWSQQAYLKASNTDTGDRFGNSVAVSGDTVAVSAYLEGSATTGVNGDQGSNSAPGSGAVYIFVRNGASWTQQAYIKSSNTGTLDLFGWPIALLGDTLAVGALSEDSGAAGVNGDQTDNSTPGSGAAYVFVRNGTNWAQQAYLKASNPGAFDQFGLGLAVSGETVVVGAIQEDSAATGVNGDQSGNGAGDSGAVYSFDLNPLPSPWSDLGLGLAGAGGVPLLAGLGSLSGGSSVLFSVTNAAPSAPGYLVLGLSALNLTLLGGVLVPFPDLLLNVATTPIGNIQTQLSVPPLLPAGISLFAQTWILDAGAISGWAATNAVTASSY